MYWRIFFVCLFLQSPVFAFTANRVWWEQVSGKTRVWVEYTIPELKELREAYIELSDIKKAGEIFWLLVRGASFYIDSADQIKIEHKQQKPHPW